MEILTCILNIGIISIVDGKSGTGYLEFGLSGNLRSAVIKPILPTFSLLALMLH